MATGTSTSIIGRERELHMVETMLADGEPSTCAVVLEGDAGIGKSAVWRWGVARAAETKGTVLTAQPADGEERLPFAALGDLLAELGDEALEPLPARQRHALDVALQRAEPDGADGSLALARGFTALLRSAAERGPLLLAIDDVQWLDQPSAEALEFALRRLGATRLRLLLTRRSTAAAPTPFGVARAVEPTRLTEIRLQPLAIGAVHHVLRGQLGRSFPRPVLRRIHETSGGNPFYAVEIARAIERRGDGLASGEALPIPPTLEELVRERLNAVSPDAHDVLKVMAALSDATPDAVAAAGCSRAGIDEAVRDGLLELDRRTLHVTHPLLASVAYDALGPAARRSLHRRLSEVVADDDQRARHLALGTSESSEAIASELEAAAQHALARGAPDFAADLAEHAARLTPEAATGDRLRRLLFGAEQCAVAGDLRRARRALEPELERLPPGAERARVLALLSALVVGDPAAARRMSDQALTEAEGHPPVETAIRQTRTLQAVSASGFDAVVSEATAWADAADRAGDEAAVAVALTIAGCARTNLGEPIRLEELDQALALQSAVENLPIPLSPRGGLGLMHLWSDELETARPLLNAELARARTRGLEESVALLLHSMADLELRAGNWEAAAGYAEQGLMRAREALLEESLGSHLWSTAAVAAHRGDIDMGRSHAIEGLRLCEAAGDRLYAMYHLALLGFLEVSLDQPSAALAYLERAMEHVDALHSRQFSANGAHANAIDALVALGEIDRAEAIVVWLERSGQASGRPWTTAISARGWGLVTAANGDLTAAVEHFERALASHERLGHPFEQARTLLAYGATLRRMRRKAAARARLDEALALFDELGASLWAAKTRAEASRLGGKAPAGNELTVTERRVAQLVAGGQSNKQAAATLSITPRTVEGHLSKIYSKLGVRSRTELAALLARTGRDAPAA